MPEEAAHKGVRISLYSIIGSIFLSLLKLIAGYLGSSSALVSDGFNSLGDIISYTVVAGGVAASARKADSTHQYGHEKLESIVSFLIAFAILATALGIGYSGIIKVMRYQELEAPSLLAVVGAVISIGAKIYLWIISKRAAAATKLNSLQALATDHFSDMLSSTGALIGIFGARFGYLFLDPIASVIIAVLIFKSAVEVFRSSMNVLMDASVDSKTKAALKASILEIPLVMGVDVLRTRSVGAGYYVDAEISCCKDLKLSQAHEVAQQVHDTIEQNFPQVRHIMVHVNPCTGDKDFCSTCAQEGSTSEK
ncbi:MAG: cation diffusion facilitator family transporter [Sphaerochaetaceae bacterium]